ncbi:cation:dicarboxylase symporter family transporter [Brenneria goodwinii]|uniref:cation:dicarboxylate symporter family transporter n=1 Tax=Brenneria goodwinii TaxID=1109412 RepID=UPI000EF1E237|nr:cation:dicarboxylase symporter family transporter [Brenneria goodwinii]MCG8155710.1 cation:dicarboxylase symporter family transporter [Brenneria goodwinii]MCG8160542.1 cation:dicarboxylase symporter family transporter [Brenneria goodwinii]MCG8166355.1 cation:dicarboxylase symporter family transporter [Brenneria goodwinii]MCG8171082.1 cation:dicarboxylase symporter family transporter [Brenneria goodwinii]MCG8176152.1 cation:dicarboxylase symporter family transporter [Brenneria goodwinii]
MNISPVTQGAARRTPWYRRLGTQVFISLILGIATGLIFPLFATQFKLLGDMFLNLIKAGVAPLVFLTIVHGIASAGDARSAGRIAWRAFVYFEVVSTFALILGLMAGNIIKIGSGMSPQEGGAPALDIQPNATPGFAEFLTHIVPDNFIGAFAKGELLQVVVLAVMVGIGILAIPPERRNLVNNSLDMISEILFAFINLVMKLAPLGTFGAVAYSVGSNGSTVLLALAELVLVFYAVIALFVILGMGLIARLAGFSIWRFLRYIKDELIIVLGTASSESVLPRLLIKLERLGCAKQTVGLVLPTGYAFNLDGTSIFMSMGVMFISHAYGVPLSLETQIGILLLMLLTSKGAATVSGGSFVVFAATVTSTGILPVEGLALIFGVYRFMSMAIATCNTVGNSVATVVVAKWSGTFDAGQAERHLYPERYPKTAQEDEDLDNRAMLPEHQALESKSESSARRP